MLASRAPSVEPSTHELPSRLRPCPCGCGGAEIALSWEMPRRFCLRNKADLLKLIKRSPLDWSERALAASLVESAGADGQIYPSLGWLCGGTGYKSKQTLRNIRGKLVARRLLRWRTRELPGGRQTSNEYQIDGQRLLHLVLTTPVEVPLWAQRPQPSGPWRGSFEACAPPQPPPAVPGGESFGASTEGGPALAADVEVEAQTEVAAAETAAVEAATVEAEAASADETALAEALPFPAADSPAAARPEPCACEVTEAAAAATTESSSTDERIEATTIATADEPAEAALADEPAEATLADEPVEAAQAAEPVGAALAAEPAEAAQAAEPAETAQSTEPVSEALADEPVSEALADEPASEALATAPASEAPAATTAQARGAILALQGELPSVDPRLVITCWQQRYRLRYGCLYFIADGSADHAAAAQLAHVCARAVADHRALAHDDASDEHLAIAYLTHIFDGYLKNPGRDGALRDKRHPLVLLKHDLGTLGVPWKPLPPPQPPPCPLASSRPPTAPSRPAVVVPPASSQSLADGARRVLAALGQQPAPRPNVRKPPE